MYCQNCGTQAPDTTLFCPNCGKPMSNGAAENQREPYIQQPPYNQQGPYVQPPFAQQQEYFQAARANSAANAGLVCGILSLIVAGMILGIIAIVQSLKAKRLGYVGGKATAGLVLGIIGLIGWVLIMIFVLPNMPNLYY